jgi:hypothetical protein
MDIKMQLPYKDLYSKNLSSLITIIKIITVWGYIGFAVSVVGEVLRLFSIKLFNPSLMLVSVIALLLAGLFALLVSFEESYRVKKLAEKRG